MLARPTANSNASSSRSVASPESPSHPKGTSPMPMTIAATAVATQEPQARVCTALASPDVPHPISGRLRIGTTTVTSTPKTPTAPWALKSLE
jgi:hypothetical protein